MPSFEAGLGASLSTWPAPKKLLHLSDPLAA